MTLSVESTVVRAAHAADAELPRTRRRSERRLESAPADFPTVLVAAQAGGAWAMTAIYRMVDPRLRRYLRAQLRDDADDVASDVWLDVARSLSTFDGDADSFSAWVFTIANRRVVDHLRRRGRRPQPSGAPVDDGALPASTSAEDEALAGRLGDAAAARIVASLPPEQARIVLLRVVGGLSVDEVAGIVGRKPGHVRVLQHRALQRLAKDFPPTCNAEASVCDVSGDGTHSRSRLRALRAPPRGRDRP